MTVYAGGARPGSTPGTVIPEYGEVWNYWNKETNNMEYYNSGSPFKDHDGNIVTYMPGQVDLNWANPELAGELGALREQRAGFNNWASQYLDPARYSQMTAQQAQQAQTAAMNQYAAMGLGGSSAAMGAATQAGANVNQAMIDRQIGDQIRINQMEALLQNQSFQDIMAIQGGFNDYQNMLINASKDKEAADSKMWGGIVQGGLTAVGAAIGSIVPGAGTAAGATAGAAIGGAIGSGANSIISGQGAYSGMSGSMGGAPVVPQAPRFNGNDYSGGQGASPYGYQGYAKTGGGGW